MSESDLDKDSLKIGDYIVLQDARLGCFLGAEGILVDDIFGMEDIKSIQDAIFCVHLQRQYSASRELFLFLETYGMDKKNITDDSEIKYLQALERGRDNENTLNDSYMKKKVGQVVLFGDVIQLYHVKSGKYLQVFPSKLAKDERENVRIGLDVNGNAFSWLQICPRFKIDKDGDRILTNTEVYLKVAERANEFVHAADRDPVSGAQREINCSLEVTSWKLSIYQASTDALIKEMLLASQLVYVNDPETKSYLSISSLAKEREEEESDEHQKVKDVDDVEIQIIDGADENEGKDEITIKEAALLPAAEDGHLDSNFLWMIESNMFLLGGPIKWKTDTIRLKHFNSGLYLMQETKFMEDEEGKRNRIYSFSVTSDRELTGTLFNISEVNSTSKYLGNEKAVQIGHNGVWVERGDVVAGSAFTFRLGGTRDKDSALSLIFTRFKKSGLSKDESEDESITDPSIRMKEPLDLYVGSSAKLYILKYLEMTIVPKEVTVNTIWPTAGRTDIEAFKGVIDKLVIFTQGFPVAMNKVDPNIDKADMKVKKSRQNLLREQGTLELILDFIRILIPIFENNVTSDFKATLDSSLLYKMAHTVQSLCFAVMYASITDNQENQMFIADSMPVLLSNLNTQPLAVKCVTEMLSNNMELQETKIGAREIQIFVDKLRNSGFSTMYLKLLQACCSCQGDGVDGNQCKVANMLFTEDSDDVIFGIDSDFNHCTLVDWGVDNSLFLSLSPSEAEKAIRGYQLVATGLPKLTLKWKSSNDGQMMTAWISDLFRKVDHIHQIDQGIKSEESVVYDEKPRVAQYLIAEMFLGAEMCLDRNYVAMHKLDNLFSYEVLVSILKMDIRHDVKAAAVRLLMCLHVDRDPQAASKIPCLTRTWSDIKKNEEPQLPFVDPSRRYMFGLIQQLISEHIREMAGSSWNELSRHMLKMLLALVKFNFYGSTERIRDLIGPLIAILDRRNVEYNNVVVDLNSKSSKWMSEKQASYLSELESKGDELDNKEEERNDFDAEDEDDDSTLSSLSAARVSSKKPNRRIRYKRILEAFDSVVGNSLVLFLVIVALGLDLYQIFVGGTLTDLGMLSLIEVGFLGIFSIELLFKLYCAQRVKGGLERLFGNPVNFVDYLAITANIILFFVTSYFNHGLSLVKALRLCRFINLITISADAKINFIDNQHENEGSSNSIRYSKAPILELETMVEAINVLALLQKIVEDRNLSLFLRNFFLWESGADRREPAALFHATIESSDTLSLNQEEFEAIMLDCLMFSSSALVQSVLEVLMSQFSMRSNILENAKNVQLIAAAKREKQFKMVDLMLQQLEQNAETHELWGEMETDADLAVNKQTKDILRELIEICRVRRYVLEFDEDYMADREIQDLYRNLGCFEICMKVMGLLDSVEEDEDGNLGEVASNTRSICLLCNELLYWFFLGNTKNQEMGYLELDFFLDTLDDEINSHMVIRAIFKNNEALMRQVPHSHLANLVDKIIKNGKSHHYLALFASISHDGERNVVENQFEIVKSLTSPGRLQKVACFFCSVDHPDYTLKRQLMEPFLNTHKDLSLEDLPPLLAYHLMFLEVLSGCTVGRMNITTVEAKVQSVFNYTDILQSILDPGTIVACKIRLSKFFYNSIIEVELKIPGLDQSPDIWKLLESYKLVLMNSKDELLMVDRNGWESAHVSRQRIEYIIVCIMIIRGFFTHYYQPAAFQNDDRENRLKNQNQNKIQFSLTHVDELILYFFTKIKEIHDLNSSRLSEEMKEIIFGCLEILNKSISGNSTIATFLKGNPSKTVEDSKIAISEEDDMELVEDPEKEVLDKFRAFLVSIESDTALQFKAENENVGFISILESLPFIADPVDAEVRYETLIKKLVFHIRENIKIVNNQKRLDSRVTKTSTWIIRAFRTMIENRMGMSIYERDDDGGLEQDIAAAPVVNALNSCGATALCLDLIAVGIDEKLQLEAIKLGVALLFKEGGALEVQQIMNNHLNKTNSELFFKQVRLTLQKLQAWHSWNQVIILPEGEEPKPPDEILIVRFLQLMCEGHYLPNQDIMREQSHNPVSYNLLDDFVNYLNCLSRIPCRTSTVAGIRLAATILEVIQGPCEGNQVHFALNTELVETLNRINRAKLVNDCVAEEEIELKKISIDIFQGLLEGQGEKSVVYERVLSVIHLDIIQIMSKKPLYPGWEDDEEQVILQTECVVLLQMFCNYRPALYDELGVSKKVEDIVGSGTAMIEVIWRGDIHRRFFHVPKLCDYLAKSSKDALIEFVDRSSPENKLIDFLNRSHDLYREVKHQQYLTEMGLSGIFSRQNQNRATWISFILAVIINAFFIATYTYKPGYIYIADVYNNITTYLNIVQVFIALFNLVLSGVVRSPVIYQGFLAEGNNPEQALFLTASDPLTLYYIFYVTMSFLGVFAQNYYCSLLLLDVIVKDATTRDVLNAIVAPRKALFFTFIFMLFVIYIFSFFIFYFYPADIDPYCNTLYNCAKWTLSYGFQNGGGVGDSFVHSTGVRLILDILFFMIVLVILVNAFLGMIIDTFGSLRAEKMVRMKDTLEVCFICNIEKQIFDRASDDSEGFKTHVKIDHNIWNYLYFIFLLWEQDRDDDDGLEQYVRRAIEADEITWFPLHKAMRLENIVSQTEITRKYLHETIDRTEETVNTKLSDFQSDVKVMLQQLISTLKQENPGSMEGGGSVARLHDINLEIDEDMSTDFTDADHSHAGDIIFGKHISIALVKIEGVQLFHPTIERSGSPASNAFSRQSRRRSTGGGKSALAKRSVSKVPSVGGNKSQKMEYRSQFPHFCQIISNTSLEGSVSRENDVDSQVHIPTFLIEGSLSSAQSLINDQLYYHDLACRIITDSEMFTLPIFTHVDHEQHILFFDAENILPLFDNVVSTDKRKFQIQILHGSNHRKQIFVAAIEIYCKELLSSDEEGLFERDMMNSQDEVVCSVSIRVNRMQAKGYGRPTEDIQPSSSGHNLTHRSQASGHGGSSARDRNSKVPNRK